MKTKTVLILAAGESSRFFPFSGGKHKSEFVLGGKTIIEHMLYSLSEHKNVNAVVVCKEGSAISEVVKKYDNASYAVQKTPGGMYDAISSAKDLLGEEFLVILPYHLEIAADIDKLWEAKAPSVMVRKYTEGDESSKAIVSVSDGKITKIAEKKAFPGGDYSVVGVYKLDRGIFDKAGEVSGTDEYVMEKILGKYSDEGVLNAIVNEGEPPSLKYSYNLLPFTRVVYNLLSSRKNKGKNIMIGRNSFVEKTVIVSDGVKIGNNTSIKGRTFLGRNAFVGDGCLVRDSFMEADSEVGFSTEVARSIICENAHIHSGYVGDSIIGSGSHIGAGFITANKRIDRGSIKITVNGNPVDSGTNSLGCIVGENVSMGIKVSTMPGTLVCGECVIGSNTEISRTITHKKLVYSKKEIVEKDL